MKADNRIVIAFCMIVIAVFLVIHIAIRTGEATARIEFSIIENVTAPSPAITPAVPFVGGSGGKACFENWICDDFSECSPSEYQTRSCFDKNNCTTIKAKPAEVQRCNYVTRPGNCFDKIQDETEEGIDCGGNCAACPSCDDGIKNQDEAEVDCGGRCRECIKLAEVFEIKERRFDLSEITNNLTVFWPVWLILSILLLMAVYLYRYLHESYYEKRHY